MPLSLRNYFSTQLHKLKTNLFFQNIALITGGTAAAKAIGILSAPIITRLYTPEDYGVFSVFAAIMGVAGTLTSLRYAVTIPLAEKEEMADNLIRLSFLITLFLSVIGALFLLFFGTTIAEAFSAEHIVAYLWVLPIAFFFAGFYETLSNWAIRNRFFKIITQTKIAQGFWGSGTKIGFGAFGIAPLGLLLGLIFSQAAGIGSLFLRFLKHKAFFFNQFRWGDIINAARRYKKFPLIQSWSQVLLGLGGQLPVFFIAGIYGVETAGLFGLAHNLISMPMNLLGASVSKVYYGEIAKYGKSNPDKIYKLSVSVMKKMFLFALTPILLILIAGPRLFSLAFGEAWFDAGVFAQIMAIFILFRFVGSPIASCLNVFEKQGTQLMLNALRVVLIAAVFSAGKLFNLSAEYAIMAYSAVFSIYALIGIYIIFLILKNQKIKLQTNNKIT